MAAGRRITAHVSNGYATLDIGEPGTEGHVHLSGDLSFGATIISTVLQLLDMKGAYSLLTAGRMIWKVYGKEMEFPCLSMRNATSTDVIAYFETVLNKLRARKHEVALTRASKIVSI